MSQNDNFESEISATGELKIPSTFDASRHERMHKTMREGKELFMQLTEEGPLGNGTTCLEDRLHFLISPELKALALATAYYGFGPLGIKDLKNVNQIDKEIILHAIRNDLAQYQAVASYAHEVISDAALERRKDRRIITKETQLENEHDKFRFLIDPEVIDRRTVHLMAGEDKDFETLFQNYQRGLGFKRNVFSRGSGLDFSYLKDIGLNMSAFVNVKDDSGRERLLTLPLSSYRVKRFTGLINKTARKLNEELGPNASDTPSEAEILKAVYNIFWRDSIAMTFIAATEPERIRSTVLDTLRKIKNDPILRADYQVGEGKDTHGTGHYINRSKLVMLPTDRHADIAYDAGWPRHPIPIEVVITDLRNYLETNLVGSEAHHNYDVKRQYQYRRDGETIPFTDAQTIMNQFFTRGNFL